MFLRKSIFGTASMLGLAGILAFSGCSSDANNGTDTENARGAHELGGLGLALLLPDGSDVQNPSYTITRTSDASFSLTGTLTITGNVASGQVNGLPAGNDYKVTLVAHRTRDAGSAADCTGSATFTVTANLTTNVNVVLQCDDSSLDTGNVTINGTFNICPKFTSTTATPVTAPVGSTVALTAAATDKDNDTLTFTWAAADGTFSAPNAASTSYTCTVAGTKSITVSVFDGVGRGCTKTAQPIAVTCTGATIDAGTTPDAGSTTPDAGSTTPDAGSVTPDAGSTTPDAGSVTPDAGTTPRDAGSVTPDAGSTTPDAGSVTPDAGTGPSARFGTAACDTCLGQQCNPYLGIPGQEYLDMCVDATCTQVFACVQRNHCAIDTSSVSDCYCGHAVDTTACRAAAFVPTGPCVSAIKTGLGLTANADVLDSFLDISTNNQAAVALSLFSCAADFSTCNTSCVTATNIPAP